MWWPMRRNSWLLLFAFVPLAGCIDFDRINLGLGTQAPAEVVHYGQQGGAQSTGMHTVGGGDTVWSVAQRYNLSPQDIVRVNGLQAPYGLVKGQRLKLPPPATYRV